MSAPVAARPRLLWPALLTVIGTAILCSLGSWQLLRMGEKRAFIERLQDEAAGQPQALPASAEWQQLDPAKLDLTRVQASGEFLPGGIASVRTTIAAGGPGSRELSGFGRWIFQGFKLADGGVVLVNRGFVPEQGFAAMKPAVGSATVTGFLRAPEPRGSFTPADLPAQREFYTRDPAAIAASLDLPPAPFYLEAERSGDARIAPAGVDARELIGRIPDNHFSYALTWFGLALTLIGVFIAFALQNRRASTAAP